MSSSKMDKPKPMEVSVTVPSNNPSQNAFPKPSTARPAVSMNADNSGKGVSSSSTVMAHPNEANSELASLFECPVCFEYVLPPILQCQNGHLVCQMCRPQISSCPTCRIPYTHNIRNLPLEKLASSVFFPCKHQGCSSVFLYKDKTIHEDTNCPYRPFPCPCPGSSCKWIGPLDQVMTHLMQQHKSITTLEGEDIVFLATDINLSGAVDWVMIQSCYNHHFMLVLEKAEKFQHHQQFFAIVVLIGSEKQAEKFMYRLELSGSKRRLLWETTPRSINEGISNAINSSDCLIFDASVAQLFSEGGNLGINVTISQMN